MVERCAGPRRCVVASCAGRCENGWRCFVNWIRGRVVVRLVAAVAGRWKCGVVVIDVAGGAGHLRVETSQRKRGRTVIEFAVGPQCSVVAKLAGRREAHLDVVNGCGRGVVIV